MATQNNATNNISSPFPGMVLTGVSYPRISGNGLATGDNDLYTVPAGKRLLLMGATIYNSSVGSITWYWQLKRSATYYRLSVATTTTTLATSAASNNTSIMPNLIFEAGDIVAINSATTNGLNAYSKGILFDNTCGLKSALLLSLSTGDNTVYTCPAGKTAFIIDVQDNLNTAGGALHFTNASGGTRTYTPYIVVSGQAVGVNYQIQVGTTYTATSTPVINVFNSTLNAGDFVSLNTDDGAATQLAWVNVVEI